MKQSYFTHILQSISLTLAIAAGSVTGNAFNLDAYSTSSVLSQGKWVKVSVENTGMHFIPAATLQSWGFSDPTRVRIHGYGGADISDALIIGNYTDDLPELQAIYSPEGVAFYAEGPHEWSVSSSGRITQTINHYSSVSYYFLTESDEPARDIDTYGSPAAPATRPTLITHPIHHETDRYAFAESGRLLYGEQFVGQPEQFFTFPMTDLQAGSQIWTRTAFATDGLAASTLSFTANGNTVSSTANISAKSDINDAHLWAVSSNFERRFTLQDSPAQLQFGLHYSGPAAIRQARLDCIDVNYRRYLFLREPQLRFTATNSSVTLSTANPSSVTVWEISDPLSVRQVNTQAADTTLSWSSSTGRRYYVAFDNDSRRSWPVPTYVAQVSNQDLHGRLTSDNTPDMIIFAPQRWMRDAEKLADIHRYSTDSLKVAVIDQQEVFNEFGSGTPDPGTFRRLLKMVWDRGNSEGGRPLRYAVFYGAPTHDIRRITDAVKLMDEPLMPSWQSDNSISDYNSYTTDDIFAMLADGSGQNLKTSRLEIAVGRVPVRTAEQSSAYLEKLISYIEKLPEGLWRNTVLTVADNGDEGRHGEQAEDMIARMQAVSPRLLHDKVYLDAYDVINNVAVGARNRMYRRLNDGTLLWNYIGHGDITSLATETMVRISDIPSMYFRRLPYFYAATCNFLQWDGSTRSGAEQMFFKKAGGIIGGVSATRTARIKTNGDLTDAVGKHIFAVDELGRNLTVGEAFRLAKNELTTLNANTSSPGDDNRLRYVMLGTPALRLGMPGLWVKIETIDGETVDPDKQITIKARQRVNITGIVCDAAGEKVSDFTGPLQLSLYDAPRSVTTQGLPYDGTQGKPITFDDQSSLLYQGRDSVINGEFDLYIAMPSEISDNFRPALMNFFARTNDSRRNASGTNSDFYVFGIDTEAEPDTIAPVIEYAYLNHESFTPGSVVNEEPMYIAGITDNVGINLSSAGIGHQMTLTIDGKTTLTDVSLYYTPYSDGRPGGTLAYPLPNLADGDHTVTLRVWDTSGNVTYHTLSFYVVQGAKPSVFEIFSDANPAQTEANFYIRHNRPDAVITVTFEVYDIAGRLVWTSSVTDRSDMFLSAPVKWDLRHRGGGRVGRGIYIYRAIVKTADGEVTSKARRIAVAAR